MSDYEAFLREGDCIEVMRGMDEASVDAIVTDPPYELGFMGKGWDSTGIANNPAMWREALRVVKPGGHLLAFSGTRTYHRMVCAIEDAGFEIRDQLAWVYGSGFPKSRNLDGDWEGWGTALKPAWEPICMARKPLVGTVAANVLTHGTGALNINGCRVGYAGTEDAAAAAAAAEIRGRQTDRNVEGWGMRAQEIDREEYLHGAAGLGRWPANLLHDGSEEVVALFPQEAGQQAALNTRNSDKTRNTFGAFSGTADAAFAPHDAKGSAARFFYCAKASKEDRNEGLFGMEKRQQDTGRKAGNPGGDNPRNRGVHERSNFHPTVKPTDLMAYLCRLVTPRGGLVLDPFMGSGSTGKAAVLEGFRFVGIELDPDYIAIARARIDFARRQGYQPSLELAA